MNRCQRVYQELYLLHQTSTPESQLQPQPQPASSPTLTPIPIVHLDSRKRKRCEFEIVADHQYTIYPSPVINVA